MAVMAVICSGRGGMRKKNTGTQVRAGRLTNWSTTPTQLFYLFTKKDVGSVIIPSGAGGGGWGWGGEEERESKG